MTEFLGPLCDLASEAGDTVDVGVVDVASRAQVPKLTELCLRRMRKDDAGVCVWGCVAVSVGVRTLLFTSSNGCLDGQKISKELFSFGTSSDICMTVQWFSTFATLRQITQTTLQLLIVYCGRAMGAPICLFTAHFVCKLALISLQFHSVQLGLSQVMLQLIAWLMISQLFWLLQRCLKPLYLFPWEDR